MRLRVLMTAAIRPVAGGTSTPTTVSRPARRPQPAPADATHRGRHRPGSPPGLDEWQRSGQVRLTGRDAPRQFPVTRRSGRGAQGVRARPAPGLRAASDAMLAADPVLAHSHLSRTELRPAGVRSNACAPPRPPTGPGRPLASVGGLRPADHRLARLRVAPCTGISARATAPQPAASPPRAARVVHRPGRGRGAGPLPGPTRWPRSATTATPTTHPAHGARELCPAARLEPRPRLTGWFHANFVDGTTGDGAQRRRDVQHATAA